MDWRENVVNVDECLVWTRRRDINGYARWGSRWAHRRVYEIEIGPVPDGHELDHTCNNPPCVNPAHLEPVTKAEHCRRTMRRLGKEDMQMSAAYLRSLGMTYGDIADLLKMGGKETAYGAVRAAIAKGLVSLDDLPTVTRLSDQDVTDIIDLRGLGVSVREIASWYGVHESQISRVSRGLTSGWGRAS